MFNTFAPTCEVFGYSNFQLSTSTSKEKKRKEKKRKEKKSKEGKERKKERKEKKEEKRKKRKEASRQTLNLYTKNFLQNLFARLFLETWNLFAKLFFEIGFISLIIRLLDYY